MNKPVLVVMAAGMGSRYGGMKQLDPVGKNGELIIDYSIYDAKRAGFETVVFVIKQEFKDLFAQAIGDRIASFMEVKYAYQQMDDLPNGFAVPENREKPWGTAHAVLSARNLIDGPFAVINADDYYGVEAFKTIYDYLTTHQDGDKYSYCMVGYYLKNTVTESGSVARGVCDVTENMIMNKVTEHTYIVKQGAGVAYSEDNGATFTPIDENSIVSMNLWGFSKSFITETEARFARNLENNLQSNPLKWEYFLPTVISELIQEEKAEVKVLSSGDKWYGVTYKEDKPMVVEAIAKKVEDGIYPEELWSK